MHLRSSFSVGLTSACLCHLKVMILELFWSQAGVFLLAHFFPRLLLIPQQFMYRRRPRGSLSGASDFHGTRTGAPGHLLLPNQFQKHLNSLLLIGRKIFLWPISEEDQPGDSDAFLHEVLFLVGRHSWVARSMGRLFEEGFRKNLTKSRKRQTLTWPQETNNH